MESKKWYLSKTLWAAVITAVVGAAQVICMQFGFDLLNNSIAGMVLAILGALGVYSRAVTTTTLTK